MVPYSIFVSLVADFGPEQLTRYEHVYFRPMIHMEECCSCIVPATRGCHPGSGQKRLLPPFPVRFLPIELSGHHAGEQIASGKSSRPTIFSNHALLFVLPGCFGAQSLKGYLLPLPVILSLSCRYFLGSFLLL